MTYLHFPNLKRLEKRPVSFAGSNLSDLPLWLAGDALLTKPLAALAKTAPIAKAASFIPEAITPALGTGVRAGATYALPINATETLMNGDGVQGFTDRAKQAPLMALGGVALHGGGQLLGKGISEGVGGVKDLLNPIGVPAEPFGPPQSLIPITRSVQRGAELGPLKLSDTLTPEYKARQAELNGTFKDSPIGSVDTPLATRTLQESIDQSQGYW